MTKKASQGAGTAIDQESEHSLSEMASQEQVLSNRVSDVKFVLVVLSSKGMVFDLEAMRQKIVLSYPDSAVFFLSTSGKPMGPAAPERVDLLIDFTGPGQRQGWFFAKKLRKRTRVAVGRNVASRKKIYDRIFDEVLNSKDVPREILQKERFVQKKVMNLGGVAFVPAGQTPPDQGKSIPLELPGMQRL